MLRVRPYRYHGEDGFLLSGRVHKRDPRRISVFFTSEAAAKRVAERMRRTGNVDVAAADFREAQ